jgi:2-isopropylmalate synthase
MRRIEIYDTTLRDGSQGEGVSFSLQDKLIIAERLAQMGFDYIEGGYPLSNEKDAAFFRRALREIDLGDTKLCAFGMTRRRGVRADQDPGMIKLLECRAPVLTIVGKTSDFHVKQVLRVSLEENLAMIAETIEYLVANGREVIYDAEHFFDGWKANPEYAAKTIQAAARAGAKLVVLCDTNGGSMPEEIRELTSEAIHSLDVPVGIHCHNDCELAVANSLAAVDAGAVQVQGTINGIGERCGNVDLVSVSANLALKKTGYEVLQPGSIERLAELSRFVYEVANMHFRPSQPFVGSSAFAHKGGMHGHAVARVTSSYEHISPELVGNTRRILVSELSGRANVQSHLEQANLQNDPRLLSKILDHVVRRENEGYQFEAAGASFDLLVRECAGTYEPQFERIYYGVTVETDRHGKISTHARVKIKVQGELKEEAATGDGPINALDAALRKALENSYPNLNQLRLMDYKVRVINSVAGSAARVRVQIESRDERAEWGTVGVSENIIEASWMALVDSIEYKLFRDAEQKTDETAATNGTAPPQLAADSKPAIEDTPVATPEPEVARQ